MIRSGFATVSLVFLAPLTLCPTPGTARTWFVDISGSGDAPTIQAAADSCAPGDAIVVGPGHYSEQVTLPAIVTLSSSSGAAATTIDGGTKLGYCVTAASAEGVLIAGLRFEGARGGYGFGGYGVLARGEVTIRDCIFENGGAPQGGAIGAIEAYGDLTLLDSQVRSGNGVLFGGTSLAVEGCLFESNISYAFPAVVQIWWHWQDAPGTITSARIQDNVFASNEATAIGYDSFFWPLDSLDLLAEGNLFVGNTGAALSRALVGIARPSDPSGGTLIVDFRQNTIARHPGFTLGQTNDPFDGSLTLIANAITGNGRSPVFYALTPQPIIECNDFWGNDVGWVGVADPTGTNGNISEAPKYCGAEQGVFTVATNSPLSPANNSCGIQIGAFGQGCGPVSVDPASWGKLKASFR